MKVNPDPDVSSDQEIDILKQFFDNDDAPSAPPGSGKFPDDSSLEFYDEEESIGKIVLTLIPVELVTKSHISGLGAQLRV